MSNFKLKQNGEQVQKAIDYALQVPQLSEAIADKLPKNMGAANVGKILVVGTDGNLTLTYMPEGGASGDVTGVLDESNNILLTGNLAEGTYPIKWKMDDGTYADAGSLVVSGIKEPAEPTNFADPTNADWLTGYRMSYTSDGIEATLTTKELVGGVVTNYVDFVEGDVITVEGIDFVNGNNRQGLFYSNGSLYGGVVRASELYEIKYIGDVTYDENSLRFTVIDSSVLTKARFSGLLTGTASDVIITITRNGTVL